MARPSALLLLFLAACSPTTSAPCETDTDCPDGRCRFGACRPICEEDLDCGSRQICSDGQCVARPECAADVDCASGFTCAEGTCRCTSDASCALNQTCVNGACRIRARCEGHEDCPVSQRCEITQGLCLPTCTFATDCAPGLDPQLAVLLYTCREGSCLRACVNDASCGAAGLICESGLCQASQCQTMSDCPAGQYCTGATNGRCVGYDTCTSASGCAANFECRRFEDGACPPGFPCAQPICHELPRCFVDPDCRGAAFCRDGHCQKTTECGDGSACGTGQLCVAGLCVPGGCRGHLECAPGQACVGGECRNPPAAVDVSALALTPRQARLVVGESVRLRLIAWTLDGSSFPLDAAEFEVIDVTGQPSGAAQVDPSGLLSAAAPGFVRVRARLEGAFVSPVEATVQILPPLSGGRRVSVVDAATGRGLVGVVVLGCDAPPADAPCPAPVEVTTDAAGLAGFPSFAGVTASFSVASPELRSDGLPRYEQVSIVSTGAHDVLVPVWPNPVQSASGFNGVISFNQVRSDGNYWLGFAAASPADPSDSDLQQLLGETFLIRLPGVPQGLPVPGSAVVYTSPGLGIPNEVKGRSLGLASPGRRGAVAWAGRTTSESALSVRSADLLAYAGAFEQEILPFATFSSLPRVVDTVDVDGDGRCADPGRCPQGPELVPDYAQFTPLSFSPRFEQGQRTEIVVSELPATFDTVTYSAVQLAGETGALPLGFSSQAAGAPLGGVRQVKPVVLRSGAPRAGAEVGEPGVWVTALQGAASSLGTGAESGRLARAGALPARVVLPPLLPIADGSTWSAPSRSFAPGQPGWNNLVSAGGELARVDLYGQQVRHRVYFAAVGAQTQVRIPESPALGASDPVTESNVQVRVAVVDLAPGITADDALDLPGAGLDEPSLLVDGYSRWVLP